MEIQHDKKNKTNSSLWSIRQYQAISSMFKFTQFTQFTQFTWPPVWRCLDTAGHFPVWSFFSTWATRRVPAAIIAHGDRLVELERISDDCYAIFLAHITLGSFNTQGFLAVSWGNSDLVILVHKCIVCDSPSMMWFSHAQGPQAGRTVREVIIFVFWWIRFQSWNFSVFS